MKDILIIGGKLAVICAVAAIVLGFTASVTEPVIELNKIRELEDTTADYTAILSKKFSKSTIDEQLFMINHLFVHLKRLSLSEGLTSVLKKETFAPRILVDMLHYLIRSDTIVDTQLLESATKAEEIANQFSALLDSNDSSDFSEGAPLITSFHEISDSLQLGIIMELFHFKGKQILPLLLVIFRTKSKVAPKIIDFLGSCADDDSVYLLNQLLEGTEDKELSKGIKKTLYRLKNKGIEVAAPKTTTTPPAQNKEAALPPPTAYFTTMDPLGERLILAIKPKSDQELNIFQFLVIILHFLNSIIQENGVIGFIFSLFCQNSRIIHIITICFQLFLSFS